MSSLPRICRSTKLLPFLVPLPSLSCNYRLYITPMPVHSQCRTAHSTAQHAMRVSPLKFYVGTVGGFERAGSKPAINGRSDSGLLPTASLQLFPTAYKLYLPTNGFYKGSTSPHNVLFWGVVVLWFCFCQPSASVCNNPQVLFIFCFGEKRNIRREMREAPRMQPRNYTHAAVQRTPRRYSSGAKSPRAPAPAPAPAQP